MLEVECDKFQERPSALQKDATDLQEKKHCIVREDFLQSNKTMLQRAGVILKLKIRTSVF